MPEETVSVRWEVATDEATEDVVASGDAPASSELIHSVHVDTPDPGAERVSSRSPPYDP